MAHAFVAAWILTRLPAHKWWLACGIIVFGALKEFLYDAKYETDPPQTFTDNLEDFAGYVTGCVIGLL
jgi:hypothetical protein